MNLNTIDNKLISICIPTYNGEKFLKEALDSISKQTYKNLEVIISDDNSSDNTLSICEEFKKSAKFPVYIYAHKPNGIGANWNNCIEKSNGEYIKFLFQDDLLYPNCIEEFLKYIHYNNEEFSVIFSKRTIISEDTDYGNNWRKYNGDLQKHQRPDINGNYLFDKSFFKTVPFYKNATNIFGEPIACFFKKEIVEKIGFYNPKMKQLLDLEFVHRILRKYKVLVISKELVYFRVHSDQTTFSNKDISEAERRNYLRYKIPIKYFQFLPWKRIILNKFKI